MGRLLASFGLCILVGCADGGDPFADGGSPPNQGGNPVEGGGNEGGASACGNGVVDADEACDGEDLADTRCTDLDFVGGELSCNPSCEFITSECLETLCGNNAVDNGEECDGTSLGNVTCISAGFAGGSIACDKDMCLIDDSGCKAALEEGFEGATKPAGFLSGNWVLDPVNYHTGFQSIRANDIGDSGTTAMSVTLAYDAPGAISFWHREQTESCCDLLHFYMDGELTAIWSTDAWQMANYPVAAGFHTFEWRFTKDGGTSTGADTVWVDDVIATGGYLD